MRRRIFLQGETKEWNKSESIKRRRRTERRIIIRHSQRSRSAWTELCTWSNTWALHSVQPKQEMKLRMREKYRSINSLVNGTHALVINNPARTHGTMELFELGTLGWSISFGVSEPMLLCRRERVKTWCIKTRFKMRIKTRFKMQDLKVNSQRAAR